VNAGKGITVAEARVGAYMEAIEYAYAEYNRASLKIVRAPAREIYEGKRRPEAILDFCPVMNAEIDLEEPLPCVEAKDVSSGRVAALTSAPTQTGCVREIRFSKRRFTGSRR
jgi:ribosomal protein S12 methylthiotransferase accessory factor